MKISQAIKNFLAYQELNSKKTGPGRSLKAPAKKSKGGGIGISQSPTI